MKLGNIFKDIQEIHRTNLKGEEVFERYRRANIDFDSVPEQRRFSDEWRIEFFPNIYIRFIHHRKLSLNCYYRHKLLQIS